MKSEKRTYRLPLLYFYIIFASVLAFKLKFNALQYISISWGIPSIFFLVKLKTFRLKYLIEAFIWSIPATILIDYSGHITRTWEFWSNPLFASTNITLWGIPIESFIWGFFFWVFYILFYEYFYDKHRRRNFPKREKLFIFTASLVAAGYLIWIENKLPFPNIEFYYLLILSVFSVINLYILIKLPHLLLRILRMSFHALVLGSIIEITSLALNLWRFPSNQFIFTIDIFNQPIPIEEFAWWFIVPMSIALMYEALADTGD